MSQISRFPLGITCHTKNQGDLKQNEKRQPVNAATKITEILELSDKYVAIAIIKMLRQAIIRTNGKEKSQQRSKRYKGEANGNYVTEKYNN